MLGYKKALEGIKEDFSDVMKKVRFRLPDRI
jgi:hypothetical protein